MRSIQNSPISQIACWPRSPWWVIFVTVINVLLEIETTTILHCLTWKMSGANFLALWSRICIFDRCSAFQLYTILSICCYVLVRMGQEWEEHLPTLNIEAVTYVVQTMTELKLLTTMAGLTFYYQHSGWSTVGYVWPQGILSRSFFVYLSIQSVQRTT